jgi:hypothetical protein
VQAKVEVSAVIQELREWKISIAGDCMGFEELNT